MQWITNSLRDHPELSLFLVLAAGYGIGELRIGTSKLGSVLGVLIAGIVVGQAIVPVSESLKNTFFMLFLFAIGYRSGPQFFQSLRSTGLRQMILTMVVCFTAVFVSFGLARSLGLDAGTAAGLFSGAMTGSAAFGAAGDTIARLDAPQATRQALQASAAVSFAVCYLIGTVLVIWVLTKLGPRILRSDLPKDCSELEREMGVIDQNQKSSPAAAPFLARAFEIPTKLAGTAISDLESHFPGYRVFVERLRRDGEITIPSGSETLAPGDRVALWGHREALIGETDGLTGCEVNDLELVEFPTSSLDIVVTQSDGSLTLGELAAREEAHGVFLKKLTRGGSELPFTLKTKIEPGDILTITGEDSHAKRLAESLGYAVSETEATDMTKVTAAIFVGALVGVPALAIGGVQIGLTMFVGVLLGGLVLGWLSSRYPAFGKVPQPALWIFDSLGLTGFLGLVGMQAGPGFIGALQGSGIVLILAAAIVVTVPHVVGMLVGRYILRMHPGIVLGACAGAGTSAPALGAILEASRSRVPVLSYSVGYSLGNVMLALGGSLIVSIIGP